MSDLLYFSKMHALGNDFIALDLIRNPLLPSPEQIRQLADRRCSIGFDQLLTLEPPQQPEHDFFSQIFNADGGEAESCFNGARCLGLFARMQKLTRKKSMVIGFPGGSLQISVGKSEGMEQGTQVILRTTSVDLEIREPLFSAEAGGGEISLAGQKVRPHLVSVGNPHAVVAIADDDAASILWNCLEEMGAAAQSHLWFPAGVNLSLAVKTGDDQMKVLVYERGAGMTPACGTAAVAVAALAMEHGWVKEPVQIDMGAGRVQVKRAAGEGLLLLRGPAHLSYKGTVII